MFANILTYLPANEQYNLLVLSKEVKDNLLQPGLRPLRKNLRITIPSTYKHIDINKMLEFSTSLELVLTNRVYDDLFASMLDHFCRAVVYTFPQYAQDASLELSFEISSPTFAMMFFLPSWQYYEDHVLR